MIHRGDEAVAQELVVALEASDLAGDVVGGLQQAT
jgi:hypothetical protein